MSALFFGLDGGQSGTRAIIGDEGGRILGRGEAGPCGSTGLGQALQRCLAAACQEAGLQTEQPQFGAACLGFSGGPAGKRAIVESIIAAEKLLITTDAAIALTAATGGEPGIVTIAGTGSIAFGRNAAGKTARAGGWGYLFGDEGSAFYLVRQALRAALRFEEGWGPATTLAGRLTEATGAATANEVLHLFYTEGFPRNRVASHAPLVDQAALEGDAVARQILDGAARELSAIAAVVRRQLFVADEPVRVSYAGGVFRSKLVGSGFCAEVEKDPKCRCVPPLHSPSVGALIEAYGAAGMSPAIRDDKLTPTRQDAKRIRE